MSRPDPLRVLFLTRYTRLGPSSRYRTFQFLPLLERCGVACTASPFFDDAYLRERFESGRRGHAHFARGLVRRLRALFSCRRFDVVVVEKELVPYCPAFVERLLLGLPRVRVLDFDDALFHVYDSHRRGWVRRLLAGKFASTARGVELVTAANPYLADYFRAVADRVEHLPTVLDPARYSPAPVASGPFTIGWIGTPISAANLEVVAEPLARFFERNAGRLLLVGAGPDVSLPGVPVEVRPWSEEAEPELLRQMHVGIMPLRDRPIERGKSGLKLLQYLASERPVVASPVGVNIELITPDVGFLATRPEDWVEPLERLARDPELRTTLGRNGRRKVEQEYALEAWAARYASFLESVAGGASVDPSAPSMTVEA